LPSQQKDDAIIFDIYFAYAIAAMPPYADDMLCAMTRAADADIAVFRLLLRCRRVVMPLLC